MFDPVDNTIQPLTNHSLGAYRSYYHFQDFMVGDKAASFLIGAVAYFTAIHMCLVYLVHGWRQRSYTKGLSLDH